MQHSEEDNACVSTATEPSQAAKIKEKLSPWKSNKLIWRYFTREEWPYAKCNSCDKRYRCKGITNLEKHLIYIHPKIIEEIQEEIGRTQLSQYYAFDVEPYKVRCIIDNTKISVFRGTNYLINHLRNCHKMKVFYKSTKTSLTDLQSIQRNDTDVMIQQSVTTEDNASTNTNTDNQQTDASLQTVKNQELKLNVSTHPDEDSQIRESQELICTWNSNNLVWRYFIPKQWPVAKCSICNKFYNGRNIANLEDHLTCKHPEVIREIRKEIRSANLYPYFAFDIEKSRVRCIVGTCKINIFSGISSLINHLCCRHNINISTTSSIMQKNLMMQQLVVKENNISTSTDELNADQRIDASLQAANQERKFDSTGTIRPTQIWISFRVLEA